MATAGKIIVPEKDVHSFIVRCLEAIRTNTEHAKALADALTCADTRGIYSHGLSRIGILIHILIALYLVVWNFLRNKYINEKHPANEYVDMSYNDPFTSRVVREMFGK